MFISIFVFFNIATSCRYNNTCMKKKSITKEKRFFTDIVSLNYNSRPKLKMQRQDKNHKYKNTLYNFLDNNGLKSYSSSVNNSDSINDDEYSLCYQDFISNNFDKDTILKDQFKLIKKKTIKDYIDDNDLRSIKNLNLFNKKNLSRKKKNFIIINAIYSYVNNKIQITKYLFSGLKLTNLSVKEIKKILFCSQNSVILFEILLKLGYINPNIAFYKSEPILFCLVRELIHVFNKNNFAAREIKKKLSIIEILIINILS